jgi:hypothetical protein
MLRPAKALNLSFNIGDALLDGHKGLEVEAVAVEQRRVSTCLLITKQDLVHSCHSCRVRFAFSNAHIKSLPVVVEHVVVEAKPATCGR